MAFSIERFWVYADDGTSWLAQERTEQIDTPTLDGPSSIPGITMCALADGTHLNRIDENTFQALDGRRFSRHKHAWPIP